MIGAVVEIAKIVDKGNFEQPTNGDIPTVLVHCRFEIVLYLCKKVQKVKFTF